ncbi:hypothetical protein PV08_07213 [Exophiala spinifera]|uniref:Uncharacterized protein n=1 Tax=Exophiala spinifera TaxID=91928 RepID=A0A0D2B6X8_9EURO|nr:uncharacterized protein PV08_07213 [Exophiala spinifera]KIW14430.1 hypothetical protein PV08_07213 [Exophiala spinifera]
MRFALAPRRAVFRVRMQSRIDPVEIVNKYFTYFDVDVDGDFYTREVTPKRSAITYIVLDLRSKTCPTVNLDIVKYDLYEVKKKRAGVVLVPVAYKYYDFARRRLRSYPWGRLKHPSRRFTAAFDLPLRPFRSSLRSRQDESSGRRVKMAAAVPHRSATPPRSFLGLHEQSLRVKRTSRVTHVVFGT